jgi:hypothetical protein
LYNALNPSSRMLIMNETAKFVVAKVSILVYTFLLETKIFPELQRPFVETNHAN